MSIKRSDLLTRTEAAEYLGMSKSWLASTKDGPLVTRIGGLPRYLVADLDAYIESRRGFEKEQAECLSTGAKAPRFSGTGLRSLSKSTAARQAKQIADSLRKSNEGVEPKLKPFLAQSNETPED